MKKTCQPCQEYECNSVSLTAVKYVSDQSPSSDVRLESWKRKCVLYGRKFETLQSEDIYVC
jgi:hypothetical protein